MTITRIIETYVVAAVIFSLIDFVWLGTVAKDLYQSQLKAYLAPKPKLGAAVAFYGLNMVGVLYFAVVPALDSHLWFHALRDGALFGLFSYATYDLTNYATIKDWPKLIVIVDMAWGTILTAVVAVLTYAVMIHA
jgi:uncharacterized membrane protein